MVVSKLQHMLILDLQWTSMNEALILFVFLCVLEKVVFDFGCSCVVVCLWSLPNIFASASCFSE